MFVSDVTWKWVKAVRALPDAPFMSEVQRFLIEDFDQAMAALKTQKLLSRSRSLEVTTRACDDLRAWSKHAAFSGAKKSQIVRHCEATCAFQQMANTLRKRTLSLELWALSYPDLCTIVISSCEAIGLSLRQELALHPPSDGLDFEQVMHISTSHQFLLRDAFDKASLILNEGRKRCAKISNFQQGSPQALVLALEVAELTHTLTLLWDAYSYSDTPLRLVNKTMRMYRPSPHRYLSTLRFMRRSYLDDSLQHAVHDLGFLEIQDQAVKEQIGSRYEVFEEFLLSSEAVHICEKMGSSLLKHQELLYSRISGFVELEHQVRIRGTRLSYKEIAKGWSAIHRLAYLAGIWIRSWFEIDKTARAPTLSLQEIKKNVDSVLGDVSVTERVVELFLARPGSREYQDFFYQPLIMLGDHSVMVVVSLVEMSRFERNLLYIVASEVNESLSIKGQKPICKLIEQFRSAGYAVIVEHQIRDSFGQLVTDLDILARKHNDLFLFQAKVLPVSDTLYEDWKNTQSLERAARQMDKALEFLVLNDKRLSALSLTGKERITPFLLTNIWSHSGQRIGGYQVTDFVTLGRFLEGAMVKIIEMPRGIELARGSLIKHEHPTGEELHWLLRERGVAKIPQAHPVRDSRQTIGEWELIIPGEELASPSKQRILDGDERPSLVSA